MKILLIEDDEFFQKFYAMKLSGQGFTVETASDGQEGFSKMVSMHPDIVLLDLIMPKADGFQVLQARSTNATLKQIPVIVFSTLGQEQDIMKAKQLGANDYINKSFFDFTKLLEKIKGFVKVA